MRCAPVKFSNKLQGDGVKFEDYFEGVGVSSSNMSELCAETLSFSQLSEVAYSAPVPNLAGVSRGLLSACPFDQGA